MNTKHQSISGPDDPLNFIPKASNSMGPWVALISTTMSKEKTDAKGSTTNVEKCSSKCLSQIPRVNPKYTYKTKRAKQARRKMLIVAMMKYSFSFVCSCTSMGFPFCKKPAKQETPKHKCTITIYNAQSIRLFNMCQEKKQLFQLYGDSLHVRVLARENSKVTLS
jgi:hypothetical protein